MFIESLRKNWHHFIYCAFSSFMTSHGSLPRVCSPPYLWRTLMKFINALNISTGIVLVIMSVRFFFVLIFIKSITLSSTTQWHILRYLTSMCFVLLWYLWFLAKWIALWLSQWIRTESYIIPKVSTNPLNHKVSFDASIVVVYSASVIERAIISCNSVLQLMIHSATVNT